LTGVGAERTWTMNAVVREDIFYSCLKSLPLFAGQAEPLVRLLAGRGELISVAKGELVCKRGTLALGLFCVVQGSVKLTVISHLGNERVVEIVGPGGLFGEASMFLQRPCPVYAEALAKTEVVFLPRGLVLECLSAFPQFAIGMLGAMSQRQMHLVRDVEVCCLQPAAARVVSYLLDNARPNGNGSAEVRLPAGKAVVASSLNLTPETFSRELHQLTDADLVTVERRTVHVHDLAALQARAVGAPN
jgi:CRP-like cAMP-binding protein